MLFWIQIALLTLPAFSATNIQPLKIQHEISKLCARVLGGLYAEDRTLRMYKYSLGSNFENYLVTMTDDDLWIDLGAGHALAMKTYLEKNPKGARLLAVSAQKPYGYKEIYSSKFKYVECILPECFSELKKKKKATLITDMLGPAFYNVDLSGVLQGSINLLKPGGRYILSADRNGVSSSGHPAFIYGKSGLISFQEYLSLVPGIEVLPSDGITFEIIKLNDDPVELPKLELIILEDGAPPSRTYQVIE